MRTHSRAAVAVVALSLLHGFHAQGRPAEGSWQGAPPRSAPASPMSAKEDLQLQLEKPGPALEGPLLGGEQYDSQGVGPGCSCRSDACLSDGCSLCLRGGCRPVWRFRGDAVLLDRSEAASRTLARQSRSNDVLLSGSDLRFTEDAGVYWGVVREYQGVAWEFAHLRDDWSTWRQATGAGNVNAVAGTSDFWLANNIRVDYASELDSFELNRHRRITQSCSWLAGFRMITLDEVFDMRGDDAASRSHYSIRTDNDLYGFQMGVAYDDLLTSIVSLDFLGKAGIYYDAADQDVLLRDFGHNPDVRYSNGEKDAVFVGEVDVGFSLRVLPRVSLRAGYQLAWLEGVALAAEQFQESRAAIAGAAAENSGGILADGFYFGAAAEY